VGDVAKLAELVADVALLEAKVERLEKSGGDAGGATYVPPDWTSEDADTQAEWLAELRTWVGEVLIAEYGPLPWLRPCWETHRRTWWELSVLQAVWLNAYKRTRADLNAAITFTDQMLPGVQARLGEYLSPCGGARGCVARVRSVS
jgi:hypothetical protein